PSPQWGVDISPTAASFGRRENHDPANKREHGCAAELHAGLLDLAVHLEIVVDADTERVLNFASIQAEHPNSDAFCTDRQDNRALIAIRPGDRAPHPLKIDRRNPCRSWHPAGSASSMTFVCFSMQCPKIALMIRAAPTNRITMINFPTNITTHAVRGFVD